VEQFGGTDQQLRSLIADAMRQLPFEHRAVIYRAYYQAWTTARIADDLKITDAVASPSPKSLAASRSPAVQNNV
jgi:DNA-directed RNA polymerase specialized sigma24 family protein